MFDENVLEAIKTHARVSYPNESCGLVLTRQDGTCTYSPQDNVADDPAQSFRISDLIMTKLSAANVIAAVVHSHPDGPDFPSERDMEQQVAWNLPFGIVSTDGVGCLDPFFWGGNAPVAPLIGRGFRYGVTDCYALIRDYYKLELNVQLREYPRSWEWWCDGKTMYQDFFASEGFYRVDEQEVRPHDCFLAQIRSETPNHAGVYVGGNQILHHITASSPVDLTRLSRREPIGTWTKFICGFWVRHESQRDAT